MNFEVVAGESMIIYLELKALFNRTYFYEHEITMSSLETADGELGREDIENVQCF